VACVEVILKNAPSTSTEFVNFFAKFQRGNPTRRRGMRHDLSISVLGLFVVDLVHLGRPSAPAPIPHFFLDIEKSKRIQRKIQGKIADFARIHGIVVKFVLTMPRQKMYHHYS
jgi:hypothetical protein